MDPVLDTVTGGAVGSIADLLAACQSARKTALNLADSDSEYRKVLAAIEAGKYDTADPLTVPAGQFTPSGYANLDTANPMVAALDNLLAQNLRPAASLADLVGSIAEHEDAIRNSLSKINNMRSRLRQSRANAARAMSGSQSGTTLRPTISPGYDVTFEKAATLFPRAYGSLPQALNFEVPKLQFDTPAPASARSRFHLPVQCQGSDGSPSRRCRE